MKRRAMCVSAVIALASLGSRCSGLDDPDTFDVAGKYVYPVPGATSNGDCRSVGLPGEGDEVLIEDVGRTSSQVVARGRLEAGHLDASITSYGTDAVCVHPFRCRMLHRAALGTAHPLRANPDCCSARPTPTPLWCSEDFHHSKAIADQPAGVEGCRIRCTSAQRPGTLSCPCAVVRSCR